MSARQHLLQSNEISVPIIGCGNQRDEMMEWWAMLRTRFTHMDWCRLGGGWKWKRRRTGTFSDDAIFIILFKTSLNCAHSAGLEFNICWWIERPAKSIAVVCGLTMYARLPIHRCCSFYPCIEWISFVICVRSANNCRNIRFNCQ